MAADASKCIHWQTLTRIKHRESQTVRHSEAAMHTRLTFIYLSSHAKQFNVGFSRCTHMVYLQNTQEHRQMQ